MVNSVRPSVVGCKLTNIYDINSKVYLLKLARTGFKCFLLLESGVRFHLTNYDRDKSSVPSNFTMKLRKHIRTRRLVAIEQLGCDRCIDLTFGWGENSFHLILELFVSGNVLLTDHEYRIVALLRQHTTNTDTKIALKEIYPREVATGLLKVPLDEIPAFVEEMLNLLAQRQENQELQELEQDDEKAKLMKKGTASAFAKKSKKRVNHSAMPMVQLLHKLAPFADPALCANCLQKVMLKFDVPCPNPFKVTIEDFGYEEIVDLSREAVSLILDTLKSVSRPCDLGGGDLPTMEVVEQIAEDQDVDYGDDEDGDAKTTEQPSEVDAASTAGKQGSNEPIVKGWVMRRLVDVPPTEAYWANEEYTPLQPDEPEVPDSIVEYSTFHHCVDEFYMKIEEHKAAEQKAQHAKSVFNKVERIRVDQNRRVEELEQEQEVRERQAACIEANLDLVDVALKMVNIMVASQIDWGNLWKEVKRQQRLGHPIAQHIHAMNLEKNELQLLLSAPTTKKDGEAKEKRKKGKKDDQEDEDEEDEEESEEEEEEEDRTMEVVPLDLSLSSHANIAKLHSKRKETREKTSRTMTHAEVAVKQAEKKAQQDLQKFKLKQTIRQVRQNWWFEKYFWFISSENYLVVAGHDPQQTEHIFARYLGPSDVFVQADVQGARTCFIRNPSGGPVPPATLREAGTMSLCHSQAWDKRVVISAWSVPAKQVIRGGPPPKKGDFVLVDGFYVQGQREFMPPLALEMGITLLFHVSDASAERHKGERRSRYLEAIAAGQLPEAAEAEAKAEAAAEAEKQKEDDGEEVLDAGESSDEEEEEEKKVDEENDGEQNAGEDEKEDAGEEAPARDEVAFEPPPRGSEEQEDAQEEEAEAEAEPGPAPEDDNENDNDNDEEGSIAAPSSERRGRVSKAERRKMKKGGGGAGDEVAAEREAPPALAKAAPKSKAPPPTAQNPAPKSLPRGQRNKAKKMKDKYADQDEDERELRLALLGSKKSKYLQTNDGKGAPDGGSDSEPEAEATQEPGSANKANAASKGKVDPKAPPPIPAGGEGGGKGQGKKGAWSKPPKEDVVLTVGCEREEREPQDSQLIQLDRLTGQPHAEDEVLYAMPMVAPYCSLAGPYTFRAKLTPGPGKKGQVLRQCLKMFTQQIDRKAWQTLVQAIPEAEATCLMNGSCKASMPGMQKLQNQVRKDTKKEKRAKDGGAIPNPTGGGKAKK